MSAVYSVHMDGSGDWGHTYISVTHNGSTTYYGLWPENAANPPRIIPGDGMIRSNDPIPNPYYRAEIAVNE